MPLKPLRPCLHPGCPALVSTGRCPAHARAYDRQRGTSAERGYHSPEHRAWRRAVLELHPTCADPDRRHPDEERLAVHADHIIPVRLGGTWAIENGQGLCHSCHSAKTMREQRARGELPGGG